VRTFQKNKICVLRLGVASYGARAPPPQLPTVAAQTLKFDFMWLPILSNSIQVYIALSLFTAWIS